MDYLKSNKKFWNKWSQKKGPWSTPYPKERIEKARLGKVEISLAADDIVPQSWLPENWKGLEVLGLAASGGQQVPVIAAAGASVTSFDFSKEQLKRDLEVCEKEGLRIKTQQGVMEDLSIFTDESFDLVVNPCSVCFTENVRKVWKEVYRILRPGAVFMTGFQNPVFFSLDRDYNEKKDLKLVNSIPYSEIKSLSPEERSRIEKDDRDCFEFGHSLSDLIGGQTDLGFKITGFYESFWGKRFPDITDSIMPSFIVTRAVK